MKTSMLYPDLFKSFEAVRWSLDRERTRQVLGERPHLDVSDSVIWLSVVCAVPPAKPQP